MMRTRRSLFVFGALLAVGVLLAPQAALAQTNPAAVTATPDAMDGSVMDLSWVRAAVADANEYDITWRQGRFATLDVGEPILDTQNPMGAAGATEMFEVTGLMPDTDYTFGVRAVLTPAGAAETRGSGGNDAWVVVRGKTSDAAGPSRPMPHDVWLTPSGRDAITISWKHGLTANNTEDTARLRYEIGLTDAAVDAFGPATPLTTVVLPNRSATSHTIQNLKVDQRYLIAVRSVGGDANGNVTSRSYWVYGGDSRQDPADYGPGQRTPDRTSQPQNVEVTPGDGYLMVTWRRDANANNYLVEWRGRNQSFDNPERQKMVPQPDASAGMMIETMIMDLDNGTEYGVVVKSRNERGPSTTNDSEYSSGASAEARAMPMAEMLDTPNPVEAVAMDMAVEVKWTAVEDATGYRVQWRTSSQSYDPSRQEDGFYQYRTGDLALSHVIDDLENGMEYIFRVIAMGENDMMSAPSDEVSATPMMPTPALPVFGVLALGAGLVAAGPWRRAPAGLGGMVLVQALFSRAGGPTSPRLWARSARGSAARLGAGALGFGRLVARPIAAVPDHRCARPARRLPQNEVRLVPSRSLRERTLRHTDPIGGVHGRPPHPRNTAAITCWASLRSTAPWPYSVLGRPKKGPEQATLPRPGRNTTQRRATPSAAAAADEPAGAADRPPPAPHPGPAHRTPEEPASASSAWR